MEVRKGSWRYHWCCLVLCKPLKPQCTVSSSRSFLNRRTLGEGFALAVQKGGLNRNLATQKLNRSFGKWTFPNKNSTGTPSCAGALTSAALVKPFVKSTGPRPLVVWLASLQYSQCHKMSQGSITITWLQTYAICLHASRKFKQPDQMEYFQNRTVKRLDWTDTHYKSKSIDPSKSIVKSQVP